MIFFGPELLIRAYKEGYFPMADSYDGNIYWHSPDPRAIFPLDKLKLPRSLKQSMKKTDFKFTVNAAFGEVIKKCADREDTWISEEIINSFTQLNELGYAHSIENWLDGELVGGLYGVSIGAAFFGESMFNLVPNASKTAFYYLVNYIKERNFILLDTQYINHHTQLLGAIEIPRADYLKILTNAIEIPCKFVDE
jgi:leucyl/phenylalanyl-tRNA--protein transferase